VERNPDDNRIVFLRDTYTNISTGQYRAVDMSISYLWKTRSLGNFYSELQSTWVDRIDIDGSDIVGTYLTPRWNGNATLSWNKGDWGVNLYGVYHGRRQYHGDAGSWGLPDRGNEDHLWYNYDIAAQYTQNISLVYRGFRHYEVTLGANNVLGTKPPVDFTDVTGSTTGINDEQPRFFYCRVEMKY
jgi:hypothetical protein